MPIGATPRRKTSRRDLLFTDRDETGVLISKTKGSYDSTDMFKTRGRSWSRVRELSFPELIEKVRSKLLGVVIVMKKAGVTRPKISFDPNKSYCDGKNIWISYVPLLDATIAEDLRLDVATGLGIHEMSHINYTDFKASTATLVTKSKTEPLIGYFKDMWNTIEDEYIEREALQEFPAYTDYLSDTKKYFFGRARGEDEPKDLIQRVSREHFKAIRFPDELDSDSIIQIEEQKPGLWGELIEVLKPYPTNTQECLKAADKTIEILKKYFTPEELEKSAANEDFKAAEALGMHDGAKDETTDKLKEELVKELKGLLSAGDLLEAQELEDGLKELMKFSKEDVLTNTATDVVAKKVTQVDRGKYERIKNKVRANTATLKRLLTIESIDQTTLNKGMRTGTLDVSKLAEAVQRVETVYQRTAYSKSVKHSICIVIDQSGSMASRLAGSSQTKIDAAVDTAVLIHGAIKNLPGLDLYMYGHTADHRSENTTLFVYEEADFSCGGANLATIDAKSNNRDGVALVAAAQRVRRHTKEHTIMIVIADGQPYASGYSGTPAVNHVKRVVEKIERDNFTVLSVSIDSEYDPKDMFKYFVPYTEAKNIPKQLSEVILKQVRKHKKVITT